MAKTFAEDGSVLGLTVDLEDRMGSFVRRRSPSDSASAQLRWPGHHLLAQAGRPFSWSDGGIRILLLNGAVHRFEKRERWRQFIIDRNGTVLVHERNGMRMLFLNGFEMWLMSELRPPETPGLYISLDSLLGWGSGLPSVTVYETLVQHRRYRRHEHPNSPAGRLRVVAQYDVDIAALARRVAEVRQAVQGWETGLGDFKARCERQVEEPGDIVVT